MTYLLTIILSLQFLGFLLFLIAFLEYHNQHEFSAVLAIISAITAYFYFGVDLATIVKISIGYLCFGIVWSIYRYKQHIDGIVRIINDNNLTKSDASNRIEQAKLSKMKSTVTAWVINWPISMILNISSDLIQTISNFVTNTMKSVYNRIYENSISKLNVQQKETK